MTLQCGIKANPFETGNITWTKLSGSNGAGAAFTELKTVVSSNSSITYIQNDLGITSVTKEAHGQYQCLGQNDLGSVSETVWVYVNCK